MCSPALAFVGASVVGMGMQAGAAGQQARIAGREIEMRQATDEYNAQVAENNAQLAEWQAQDAIRRGHEEERNLRLQAAQLKSTQRATLAARGLALDSGSPVDILSTTDYLRELDALAIQDNARRAAWGYRTQGTSYSDQADALRASAASLEGTAPSAGMATFTSLLGSATQVAPTWYNMYRNGAFQGGGTTAAPGLSIADQGVARGSFSGMTRVG